MQLISISNGGSKRLKNDDLEQESKPIKIFGLTRIYPLISKFVTRHIPQIFPYIQKTQLLKWLYIFTYIYINMKIGKNSC